MGFFIENSPHVFLFTVIRSPLILLKSSTTICLPVKSNFTPFHTSHFLLCISVAPVFFAHYFTVILHYLACMILLDYDRIIESVMGVVTLEAVPNYGSSLVIWKSNLSDTWLWSKMDGLDTINSLLTFVWFHRSQVRNALNAQTLDQFRAYAAQYYPDNEAKVSSVSINSISQSHLNYWCSFFLCLIRQFVLLCSIQCLNFSKRNWSHNCRIATSASTWFTYPRIRLLSLEVFPRRIWNRHRIHHRRHWTMILLQYAFDNFQP